MIEQLYVYFLKMLPKRWMIEKLFISHYSWEPRYLFVWPTPQVCPLLCLICRKKYFCKISDTSVWSTYIIRILVPTLRYIVFRCDTLYLDGNLFNVQFIQSNTMPSWHNWTNIFDTEIFGLLHNVEENYFRWCWHLTWKAHPHLGLIVVITEID